MRIVRTGLTVGAMLCVVGLLSDGNGWAFGQASPAKALTANDERERAPAPSPELPAGDDSLDIEMRGLMDRLGDSVTALQAGLAKRLPLPLVWVVLASPLWLLAILIVVLRHRRQSGARSGRGPGQDGHSAGRAVQRPVVSAAPVSRKDGGPTPEEATEWSPAQRLLFTSDGDAASIHEAFVALGADEAALQALSVAIAQSLDPDTWLSAIAEQRVADLRPLRRHWVKEIATRRVVAWLERHPLVTEERLIVNRPGTLDRGDLANLTLTQHSGLGTALRAPQRDLMQRSRAALQHVYDSDGDPYSVHAAAGVAGLPDGVLSATGDAALASSTCFQLCVLLHGLAALRRGSRAGLTIDGLAEEFEVALERHQQLAGTVVPAEGCVAHALHSIAGAKLDGIGTLLAAVAGAAYSAQAVVLRISKLAADVPSGRPREALADLGRLVMPLIETVGESHADRLRTAFGRLFGRELLAEHARWFNSVAKAAGRRLAEYATWAKGAAGGPLPVASLMTLHRATVAELIQHAAAAEQRAFDVLRGLANAGPTDESRRIAYRRLGYAVAGFGETLWKPDDAEMIAAVAESLAGVNLS